MAFRLSLDQDIVPVEPGATAPLTITVVGDPRAADRFELEVEGVDPEWKAVPVPVFGIDAGETHSEKLFFKPPRSSESGAGNYPFVVRLRSLESGDVRTAQGILAVKAFHHLSAEVSPKKGYFSPLRHQNEFDIAVMNLGNQPLTIQLTASDPEDACAYAFEHDHLEIGPGQQRDVTLRVSPRRSLFVASGRLIGFTVSARASDVNNVAAQAAAQLEQRAFLSPVSVVGLALLAGLAGAWWISRPQRPTVSLMVDRAKALKGESVTLTWNAAPGATVHIESDKGDVVYDGDNSSGNKTYAIDRTGTLTFSATATRDGLKQEASSVLVEATAPEVAPPPAIRELSADPARVKLGQQVTLRYKFSSSVTDAKLAPTGDTLDPGLTSFDVTPTKTGTIEYEVVARNKDGKQTTREVKVEVYDESEAQIIAFSAEPQKVAFAGDPVTVSWQTLKAVTVQLKINDGPLQAVEMSGERQFPVTAKTHVAIIAFDVDGRRIMRELTIEIQPQTVPPPGGPTDGTGMPPSTVTTGGGAGPDPVPTTTGTR